MITFGRGCSVQGFTSNWESLRPAAPRFLTVFFYIFYVLFAIVLINLFIGIVTDAFPKVRVVPPLVLTPPPQHMTR